MGLFSKDVKSLDDLFLHGLQDIYYAENRIIKSLPKMIDAASSAELKRGFQQHLRETEGQVKRLEKVFDLHGTKPSGTKCQAIEGILGEGDHIMGEVEGEELLDMAVVAAAQAVEHYEIARYGALIAWAKELARSDFAALLAQNLAEEKATDEKLSLMAERRINPDAGKANQNKTSGGKKPAVKKAAPRKRPAAKRRGAPVRSAPKKKTAARRRA